MTAFPATRRISPRTVAILLPVPLVAMIVCQVAIYYLSGLFVPGGDPEPSENPGLVETVFTEPALTITYQ